MGISLNGAPAIFSSGVRSLGVRFVSIEEVGGRAVIQELVSMLRVNINVSAFKDLMIKLVHTFSS